MKHFKAPKRSIGDLDAKAVARVVAASADLALVLAQDGTIRDVSLAGDDYERLGCADWAGRHWRDVVTPESANKVDEMLRDARVKGEQRWRQVNHPTEGGQDIPVRYQTIRLSGDGPILAIGRDMQPIADLQQKLVAAQSQMERDYARISQAETRYQALFRFSGEALLVADASSLEIVDANHACVALFANGSRGLVGRRLTDLFAERSQQALDAVLAVARTSPKAEPIELHLAKKERAHRIEVGIFRDQRHLNYIVRFISPQDSPTSQADRIDARRHAKLIEALPDGFAVLDRQRRILSANGAFLETMQLATADQAKGEFIGRWLGRADVDVDVLFANLSEHGVVSRYKLVARGEYGAVIDVEVSGVASLDSDPPCYGLIIRRDTPALSAAPEGAEAHLATPQSAEQLKELVGRTPLKELVRQTTDIVERMCIEAALELTGDNRASAAEMLGLSRQSLYLKLRRHQLGGLGEDDAG